MSGSVRLDYHKAMFTSPDAKISVINGEITLGYGDYISFDGAFTFGTFIMRKDEIVFHGLSSDFAFNGSVSLPISAPSSGDPKITTAHFTGTVDVSWPSSDGHQHRQISSGDLVTLTDFSDH